MNFVDCIYKDTNKRQDDLTKQSIATKALELADGSCIWEGTNMNRLVYTTAIVHASIIGAVDTILTR
jgi:hypothetical protein